MCVSGVKLFCVLCLAQWVRTENDTNSVYFSLILSGGEYGFRSWDAIPAIDIALEAIKDNQLLPAYNFAYKDERNSKVKGTVLDIATIARGIATIMFGPYPIKVLVTCYMLGYRDKLKQVTNALHRYLE